jgi:hypothetical protein
MPNSPRRNFLIAVALLVPLTGALPAGARAELAAAAGFRQTAPPLRSPGPRLRARAAKARARADANTTTSPNPGNGLETNPEFFPIAVWLQTATHTARKFHEIGVNTFIAQWEGNTEEALRALKEAGEILITEQESVALNSPYNSVIKAWQIQPDEPDDAQPNGEGGYGPCVEPSAIIAEYHRLKKNDPTRPVYVGFGRGVAETAWPGRGPCTGDTAMYPEYAEGTNIVEFDVYPVNQGYPLSIIATGVENLHKWAGNKPLFTALETTPIEGGHGPTPAQIRAETWLALIHGANGINYFCDIIGPTFVEEGCLTIPKVVAQMKADDAQIASLAPVLNSDTIIGGVTVTSKLRVDTMEKAVGGETYLFTEAVGTEGGTATFNLTGFGNAKVTVIGDHRTITMSDGTFKDGFHGYGVHLFEISGEAG